MELSQARVGDVTVIAVSGRIDHANAEAFKSRLWPALTGGDERLLLDLAALEYISSAGLRVLVLASREVKGRDGALALCSLQPLVREIFAISRFDVVFPVYADRAAALAALARARAGT